MKSESVSPAFFGSIFFTSSRKKMGSTTLLHDKIKLNLTLSCYENTRNTTEPQHNQPVRRIRKRKWSALVIFSIRLQSWDQMGEGCGQEWEVMGVW